MKRIALLLSFAAAGVMAQTLTQKIEVSVVNVDVVVTTPDGKPVHGLTRDDFQLFEDGVAQPVTNFYAVEQQGSDPSAKAAADAPASDDARFRRKVLVLIDNNHISKHYRDLALEHLEKFINDRFSGGEYDWSIAAIGSHVGMVMPLTSDKAKIHATLQTIRTGGTRAPRPPLPRIAALHP